MLSTTATHLEPHQGTANTPGSVEMVSNAEEVVLTKLKGPRELPQELMIGDKCSEIKDSFHC